MATLTIKGENQKTFSRDERFTIYQVDGVGATKTNVVAAIAIVDGLLALVNATPSYAAFINFYITDANGSISALDVDIVGLGADGVTTITETLSLDNSGAGGTIAVSSVNQYSKVISLTLANAAGITAVVDTISVGTALLANVDFDIPRTGIFTTTPASDDFIALPSGASSISIDLFVDQVSDEGGFVLEQSLDGVTVHRTNTLTNGDGSTTITSGSHIHHELPLHLPFFRVRYQNGAVDQGSMFLDVHLGTHHTTLEIPLVISGTSSAGAPQTVSYATAVSNIRIVEQIFVEYSANFSGNVTVTLNSHLGAAFDTVIHILTFTADKSGFIQFGPPLELAEGDSLDVLAPLLAAETSQIAIYGREIK